MWLATNLLTSVILRNIATKNLFLLFLVESGRAQSRCFALLSMTGQQTQKARTFPFSFSSLRETKLIFCTSLPGSY
jgi:hypothetical protein